MVVTSIRLSIIFVFLICSCLAQATRSPSHAACGRKGFSVLLEEAGGCSLEKDHYSRDSASKKAPQLEGAGLKSTWNWSNLVIFWEVAELAVAFCIWPCFAPCYKVVFCLLRLKEMLGSQAPVSFNGFSENLVEQVAVFLSCFLLLALKSFKWMQSNFFIFCLLRLLSFGYCLFFFRLKTKKHVSSISWNDIFGASAPVVFPGFLWGTLGSRGGSGHVGVFRLARSRSEIGRRFWLLIVLLGVSFWMCCCFLGASY